MRRVYLWKSGVFRTLLSVLWGLVWLFVGLLLLSGILLLTHVPERMLMLAADCFWSISAFLAGSRAGFHARRHGMRTGLLCGLLLCAVLLAGNICTGGTLSIRIGIRCILILLASLCGGVRGVNRKLTKPPY